MFADTHASPRAPASAVLPTATTHLSQGQTRANFIPQKGQAMPPAASVDCRATPAPQLYGRASADPMEPLAASGGPRRSTSQTRFQLADVTSKRRWHESSWLIRERNKQRNRYFSHRLSERQRRVINNFDGSVSAGSDVHEDASLSRLDALLTSATAYDAAVHFWRDATMTAHCGSAAFRTLFRCFLTVLPAHRLRR